MTTSVKFYVSNFLIILFLSTELAYGEQFIAPEQENKVPINRPKEDERPDQQFSVMFLGRVLTFGGEIEMEWRDRRDRSLGRRDDDDNRVSVDMDLEALYTINDAMSLFLKLQPSYRAELYTEGGDAEDAYDLKLSQVWFYFPINTKKNMSLRIGRQYLGDDREWWFDDELDAIQFLYRKKPLRLSFTFGTLPGDTSLLESEHDVEEDIYWLIAHANWRWKNKHRFEIFLLSHLDQSTIHQQGQTISQTQEDETDANLTWLGLRQSGRFKMAGSRWQYWLDFGAVAGRETVYDFDDVDDIRSTVDERIDKKVSGWGYDVGITWELPWRIKPRLTWVFASGSGDNTPNNDIDNSYRQTGLHSNDDRFRGKNSFRYYGETLRPELSNLSITTIALGFALGSEGSVEIVHHQYSQHHASDELRGASLRTDPEGENTNIGQEINLIFGFEYWENFEMELVAARFRAGDAYGEFSGKTSSRVSLELEYSF